MASKRRVRRHQCQRKRQYTKNEAFSAALRLRKQMKPGGKPLDAYPCDFGPHWHVGHRPKAVQQSITSRRKASV